VTTILAICTTATEELPRPALELLACARQLADHWGNTTVQAALLGPELHGQGQALVQHGADHVCTVAHPSLTDQAAEIMLGVSQQIAQQVAPDVILATNDLPGAEVLTRLAYRLATGIITDCVGFEAGDGPASMRWIRPTYGGKALAHMQIAGPVQVATLRSRAFEPLPADPARQGAVEAFEVNVADLPGRVSLVEEVVQPAEGIRLEQAQIIVSGGRGMGAPEEFVHLRKLAGVLGAAVAGSRAAADAGWVTHEQLVGQTGKIVAPKVYLAVGISGAPQHMSGVISAKTIVAINTDDEAPIFSAAHLGVLGDWREVIPAFTTACEKLVRGGG
jgi:electron transfer flavoprotein alpha subunit